MRAIENDLANFIPHDISDYLIFLFKNIKSRDQLEFPHTSRHSVEFACEPTSAHRVCAENAPQLGHLRGRSQYNLTRALRSRLETMIGQKGLGW